jgi:hypothetical protein
MVVTGLRDREGRGKRNGDRGRRGCHGGKVEAREEGSGKQWR